MLNERVRCVGCILYDTMASLALNYSNSTPVSCIYNLVAPVVAEEADVEWAASDGIQWK